MPAVSLFALTPASWNCSPAACSTLRHGILGVRSLAWGISMDPQNFTRLVPFFWASYVWRSTNYWAAPGLISSFNRFTSSSARVRSALAGHPENALKSASDPGYSSNFPWKNLETLGLPRSKKMEMEARSRLDQVPELGSRSIDGTVLGEMIPRIGPLGWCLCRRGFPSELSWFGQLYLSWHPTYKNFISVVSVHDIFAGLSRNVRI
jgi:hypothetical protein